MIELNVSPVAVTASIHVPDDLDRPSGASTSITLVQELLGHEDPAMAGIYGRLVDSRLVRSQSAPGWWWM
jgi:integrase